MSKIYHRICRAENTGRSHQDDARLQALLKKYPNHADRLARLSVEGRLRYSVDAKPQHNDRRFGHD